MPNEFKIKNQLVSTVTTGTAPISVSSTTRVDNLNVATAGTADKVNSALTFNNGGTGAASGSTFDGSSAVTISYNSIGAAPTTSPTFTTGINAASTTMALFDTTATTINFAGAATTGNFGYDGTATSTTNLSVGAVASGSTKTVNIGTGGVSGSTTNINIGDADGGRTSILSPSVIMPGSISVGANILATLGPMLTLTRISGGSGYMNGVHNNVALTGSSTGNYALATVDVSGGVVQIITLTWGGQRYAALDNLIVPSLATTLATTGASGTGTTATITFAAQPTAPFEIGSQIIVAGITPTGYNGTFTVTACTTTSVSYANTTTGAQTVAGTVKMGEALTNAIAEATTIQGSDVYVSSNTSNSIGARIRLESNDTSLAAGQEYGAIVFGSRDSTAQGSGDVGLIRGISAGANGGSQIEFWTGANASAPTRSAVITSGGNFRLYNAEGTFYSEFNNSPTANRTVTFPDSSFEVASTNTAQTVSARKTFTASPVISGTAPIFEFEETDQAVDNKRWYFWSNSGTLRVQAISDAGSGGEFWEFVRSNNSITSLRGTFGGGTPSITLANNNRSITFTGANATVGTTDATSLSLSTNGTAKMTILSGGNVGIGKTDPAQALDVVGQIIASSTVTAPTFNATSTTNGGFQGIATDTVTAPSFTWTGDLNTGMYKSGTNAVSITSGGTQSIEFGTTNILSNRNLYLFTPGNANATSGTTIVNSAIMYWRGKYWNGTASANIEFNALTVPTDTSGAAEWRLRVGTSNKMIVTTGGVVSATDFNSLSDANYKDNIKLINDPLENISKIRGVTFTRIDQEDPQRRHMGVIAQEVEQYFPEVVNTNNEGIKTVNYGAMAGLFIESIKELTNEINNLKQKIQLLEQK